MTKMMTEIDKVDQIIEQGFCNGYEWRHPLLLLNTSIITAPGVYRLSDPIPQERARKIVHWCLTDWNMNIGEGILSAIGHEATAQIMTELLGTGIDVNRIASTQASGQLALVFKLRGRPPEGTILARAEVEQIGYDFQILERQE